MRRAFDARSPRAHLTCMTQRPEIRVIVLDTREPVAVLAVENWSRERALAFHGLPETKKPRQRALTGRKRTPEGVSVRVSGVGAG